MPLSTSERKLVAAIAATMFPRGGAIDVDSVDAGVVAWVEDYLDRLPRLDRLQLQAFFRAFDAGFAVTTADKGRRFVDAHPDERRDYLDAWEHSPRYAWRMGWQGLRMVFTMAYAASPAVREAMGEGEDPRAVDEPVEAVPAEARRAGEQS